MTDIKVGYIRQLYLTKYKLCITFIDGLIYGAIRDDGYVFKYNKNFLLKHSKPIAEYPNWQEAVASKEFKG